MIQAIPVSDKLRLARFLSGIDAQGRRIAPAFRSVLFLLVDCAASRRWSSDRIAAACGVSVRTVGRAFAYWRACGVLELRRHQHHAVLVPPVPNAALPIVLPEPDAARQVVGEQACPGADEEEVGGRD